ncbi:MAG: response regulator [Anaerolineae bacterium]
MSEVRGPRALVVEDDQAWQQIVSEILLDCGLEVDVAASLEEATFLLRRMPHRVAVVDLALGEGEAANQDGLRVLEAVRRQDPGCASILLTGYATVELAVKVLRDYGGLSCLRKASFDRTEFRDLVARALLAAPPSAIPSREAPATGAMRAAGGLEAHESSCAGAALVVEDDAGWRSLLSEMLTDVGYRVRLCNSYGEAAGCLRREPYRLAVVDLSLCDDPGVGEIPGEWDGYHLLALAAEHDVTTIVVSGIADPDVIERAYDDYGIFAYLEKQAFDRRAFLEAVAEAERSSEVAQQLDALTPRESEVLALLAQGMTNKEMAEVLVISTNTIKRHLKSIFDKLDVHTRAAAAAKAVGAGVPSDAP